MTAALIGPVFTREAAVAPRRISFYAAPTIFVTALFALMLTAWQLLVGAQQLENLGDLAWFAAAVFQILAPLQLAVAMPFAALLVASAVALEKDRKTLDLLLMTNLTNPELVLGKLLAAMLNVLLVVTATLPLFMIIASLGGVSTQQILEVQAVTLASALVAGSLGSTFALWREKTFQALAMTLLALVLWLVAWESVGSGMLGRTWLGYSTGAWATTMSPWRAVQAAARPRFDALGGGVTADPVTLFLFSSVLIAVVLNLIAIAMVRIWNPSRETGRQREDAEAPGVEESAAAGRAARNVHSAGGKVRPVWDNPVLWREIRTWAYGRRILVIKLAYWAMFGICAMTLLGAANGSPDGAAAADGIPPATLAIVALLGVSLVLLNALAVTSLTNERDARALDLLLVTDLSPQEIVFGKLGGAFYNAKDMCLLPLLLFGYLWWNQRLTTENLLFLLGGLAVMNIFSAVLGLHAGITYANSRTAIATSIGTMLFLFLGIATCMRIMLAFTESFQNQLLSFSGFMAGGGVGLFIALGWRNPSAAIAWSSMLTPFATFFIITSFLLGNFGLVFLITAITYGFATGAMLVPAISEFDVATGRTTVRDE